MKKNIINLKVPDSKKTDEWYKDVARYLIPEFNNTIEQYEELKSAYEFVNNDLSSFKKEINQFCNPLGNDFHSIQEDLKPFNKVSNKINAASGELLSRAKKNKVILLNSKALAKKDKLYTDKIKQSVEEKIQLELESTQIEDPKEREEFIKQQRSFLEPEDLAQKTFLTDTEIFCNKALKYCRYDQDIDLKQRDSLADTMIADRFFIYSGWKNGKPCLTLCNTLHTGFFKSPQERFIQKGDYVWNKKAITISDVIQNYSLQLKEEEIEQLISLGYDNNTRVDKRHDIFNRVESRNVSSTPALEYHRELVNGNRTDYADKNIGQYQGQGTESNYNYETLVWETHLEFKGFKEIIFLSYKDEYNKRIYEILDKSFKIPSGSKTEMYVNRFGDKNKKYMWEEDGVNFEAEKMYIPWKHEVTRLGNDIYVNMREVPFQPVNMSNPFTSFELSYKGAIFNSLNAKSLSPVQRAIPAFLQYSYIKHLQLKEMAKYQGYIQDVDTDQIPERLGQDKDGNLIKDPVAAWMAARRKLSINFYSGSQNSLGGLPNYQKSPGSKGYILGTSQELINLQNLANMIDVEASLLMGFSPQREAMYAANSNVSDNQQAISQSYNITEPMFHLVMQVWKYAFNDYLYNFREYARMRLEDESEVLFHYLLEDGSEELLEITPEMLDYEEIGLFISDTSKSQKYIDIMTNMVHSIAQNAGEGIEAVSNLVKAITSGASPEEVHKMIQLESSKQSERASKMQQQQLESQEKVAQMQIENREDTQEHEINRDTTKELLSRQTQIIVENIKATNLDRDKDGVKDEIESELKREEVEIKKQQVANKSKVDDETLKLKKQDILQKNNKPN